MSRKAQILHKLDGSDRNYIQEKFKEKDKKLQEWESEYKFVLERYKSEVNNNVELKLKIEDLEENLIFSDKTIKGLCEKIKNMPKQICNDIKSEAREIGVFGQRKKDMDYNTFNDILNAIQQKYEK